LYGSIVAEVTDDKSLPKAERKRLQIVNAPKKSPGAKLVKLADKLYNLRDLDRVIPESVFLKNETYFRSCNLKTNILLGLGLKNGLKNILSGHPMSCMGSRVPMLL
jgi:hypothetical protein